MRTFISYRRVDSRSIAGRVKDRLDEIFGASSAFLDTYSIPAGIDFGTYIKEEVAKSDVVLVLVGPHWTTPTDPRYHSKLLQPDDYVFTEIETAFALNIPVIPILVDGANLPPSDQLPQGGQRFLYLNAARLRPDPDFPSDFRNLLRAALSLAGFDSTATILATTNRETYRIEMLPGEVCVCGRDPGCDLQLYSDIVGRRHASLTLYQESLVLQDLQSVNGVYLNGERIDGSAFLTNGDRLRFGKSGPEITVEHAPDTCGRTRVEE